MISTPIWVLLVQQVWFLTLCQKTTINTFHCCFCQSTTPLCSSHPSAPVSSSPRTLCSLSEKYDFQRRFTATGLRDHHPLVYAVQVREASKRRAYSRPQIHPVTMATVREWLECSAFVSARVCLAQSVPLKSNRTQRLERWQYKAARTVVFSCFWLKGKETKTRLWWNFFVQGNL